MSKVLVLGAGYAGMMAALRLDRRADVTVVNGREHFVERIRLHQVAAGQKTRRLPIADLLRRPNIRFVQGWVESIDLDQQVVRARLDSGSRAMDFDYLVYALGSSPATGDVPGVAAHAYTLSADGERGAAALHAALPAVAARGGTIAVVGSGLTGIETAAELAEAYPGLRVRLIARSSVGAGLSRKGRQHLARTFAKLGIETMPSVGIRRVMPDGLETTTGERLPVVLTVWAASFAVPALARQAGLAVDSAGRVLVDPMLRSRSHANVFAAGDAAAVVEASGVPIRMACATAMPAGTHAAANINRLLRGEAARPFGFHYAIQCISLGRHEALVQLVDAHDRSKERIITGRAGAWVKEMICWFTVAALRAERRLPGLYAWPGRRAQGHRSQRSESAIQHG